MRWFQMSSFLSDIAWERKKYVKTHVHAYDHLTTLSFVFSKQLRFQTIGSGSVVFHKAVYVVLSRYTLVQLYIVLSRKILVQL